MSTPATPALREPRLVPEKWDWLLRADTLIRALKTRYKNDINAVDLLKR